MSSHEGKAVTFNDPLQISGKTLKNRIIMSPMTRNRATIDLVPTDRDAEVSMLVYYEQRASAGMIIVEANMVSPDSQGYPLTPGIYTPQQIEGWKKITEAIHAKGCLVHCQLWHSGRVSHNLYQPNGRAPQAPSPVKIEQGMCITMNGLKPFPVPREMTVEEIETCVGYFRQGAYNALKAGFDGIELHAANGYLMDQFLKGNTNKRTDKYGGSPENRFRFLREVVEACQDAIGKDKVGVHLSPGVTFNECIDEAEKAEEHMEYYIKELDEMSIAYLFIKLADEQDVRHGGKIVPIDKIRKWFSGVLIANNRFNEIPDYGENGVGKDYDAVAFGRAYIANPDLPTRIAKKAPMNAWDSESFYGGTSKGYTDYPTLDEQETSSSRVAGS